MAKRNYVDTELGTVFFWERRPKGEVGIEVEVEGGPWPNKAITNWITHADGSLRNNGIEYIIRQPVNRDKVSATLTTLREGLANAVLDFSYRTSIHVHINIQDLTIRELVNYVTIFAIFEELLVNVVGPERAGNKFCLRFKDADEALRTIPKGLNDSDLGNYLAGDFKYASCNLRAVVSHGTLEFRAMRGNLEVDFINDWVQLLLSLKDAAKSTKSPRIFVEELSHLGPQTFAQKYLPKGNRITAAVLGQYNKLGNSLFEGARLVQDIAYCMEWGEPQPRVGPSAKKVEMAPPEPDFPIGAQIVDDPFEIQEAAIRRMVGLNPEPFRHRIPRGQINPFHDMHVEFVAREED